MQVDNLVVIATAEIITVLLIFCLILWFQNRSLRRLIGKLQTRMEELIQDLKLARQAKAPPLTQPAKPGLFKDHINEQLALSKRRHESLRSPQDIVLDLSPDAALPHRVAALRYAMLLAEKEAWANVEPGEPPKWDVLQFKYQQIFSFYEDYLPQPEVTANHAEVDTLNQELTTAKRRINNLEKFKALYFDLEEKWESSKQTAKTHYENLSEMAEKVDDRDAFESALNNYHAVYNDINKLIEQGIENEEFLAATAVDEKTVGELRHLRAVAADQHKIITELQAKLRNAQTEEVRIHIIDTLKVELTKQARFVQESETCIQLMEDELKNAKKEISQLKDRLKTLPSLKTQLIEAKEQRDAYELKMYALTSENRKLTKRLKEDPLAITLDDPEVVKLKKEINELETRYANLEEKYLDLKIKQ